MIPGGLDRPYVGRRKLLEEAVCILSSDCASSIALTGEAGIGKTAFMHQVLLRVEPRYHVVRIRTSKLTANHPLGALGYLLGDLAVGPSPHPVHIVSVLGKMLKQQAGNRSIVVAVDDAGDLDDFSSIVLSELAYSNTVRMVLAANVFAGIPLPVSGMWQEGLLHRINLRPLDTDECGEYLESELESMVAAPVVHALTQSSGGNPLLLKAMCRDLRQAQQTYLRDGVWVMRPGGVRYGLVAAEAISHVLETLTAGEKEVIDVLSLAGSLPLLLLLRIGAGADIDLLQDKGVLSIGQRREHMVQLSSTSLSQSGSWRLGAGRRWKLYQKLLSAVDSPSELPLGPLQHAQWIIGYGGSLSPELAYSAAHEANEGGEPDLALELVDCSRERTLAVVSEAVTALTALGDHQGAQTLLDGSVSSCRTGNAAGSEGLRIAEARLLQHASRTGAERVIQEAKLHLQPTQTSESLSPRHLSPHQALVLAQAELASFEGNFIGNAEALSKIYQSIGDDSVNFKAQIGSWLCEAWALTDRQDQGLELAAELKGVLTDPRLTLSSRRLVQQRAAEVVLLTASFAQETHALSQVMYGDVTPRYPGEMPAEILEGIGHAHRGHSGEALSCLLPALGQLRAHDPFGALPVATAATAYCHAVEGRIGDARLHSGDVHTPESGSWKMRRWAAHFTALTLAIIGSKAAAIEELNLLSEKDRRQGVRAYELLTLYHLARLGDSSAPDRLLATASCMSGPFTELCSLYGKGMAGQDPIVLIQAAELAKQHGHSAFCNDAAEVASKLATGSHARADCRRIQRSARWAMDEKRSGAPGNRLDDLTAREREIAARVAEGLSSKWIAGDMFVSVRTVEGHLYRIYAKLSVRNRAELARVVTQNVRP